MMFFGRPRCEVRDGAWQTPRPGDKSAENMGKDRRWNIALPHNPLSYFDSGAPLLGTDVSLSD